MRPSPRRDTQRETEKEAEKVRIKLLNQVDERRSPRTEATVNELLDRWLEVIDIEKTTRTGYVGKIEKHIRPTIGRLQVGRVRADTIENLYAQLRRCREHCKGAKYTQHRTEGEHICDEHSTRRKCAKELTGDPKRPASGAERACGPHRCAPLAPASIRVVHAILSGSFTRAGALGVDCGQPGRADRAAADAAAESVTPDGSRSRTDPRGGVEGPRLGCPSSVHDDHRCSTGRSVRPALVPARPR